MQPVTTPRVFSQRYELTHLVARGGMAQVYRAHDRLLDRPVALKVLFPELSVDRAFVERFRREAQAAANLSHPNIVPVFDWGEDEGTYYIVMEYVDGEPLSQALRAGGPMPPPMVAHIGARVADALAYAHRHGVVHRDVKPGNVLLTSDRQVKVTDFGIARAVNTEESLTQTGAVMGTATYFSPEQAEGLGVDGRSDIYSLGVVLFEMVAGRPPFLGDSPVAVASKHVRDHPPQLRELRPTVPPDLEAIVAKAMAKSVDQRYQSAADFRADLQRFSEGRPVAAAADAAAAGAAAATTTAALRPEDTPPRGVTGVVRPQGAGPGRPGGPARRRSNARRWAVLVLVLVVVAGAVTFFALRGFGTVGTKHVTLPTLRNDTVAQAKAQLTRDGLVAKPITRRRSTTVAKNHVISTTPAKGATLTSGSHVALVVSSGPVPRVTVPTVTGRSYTYADLVLTHEGLRVTQSTQPSTKPTDTVLSQTPVAGTKVKKHATVHLVVSQQSYAKVPKVLGDSLTEAGSTLGAAGLTPGSTTKACSTQYPTGTVMTQTPAEGTKVTLHSKVSLVISTDSLCKVAVPHVVGKTESAAAATLSSKSLIAVPVTTTVCTTSTTGLVVGQTPVAGTKLTKNSTVTIDVCNAPPPPTTTTTTTTPSTSTPTSTTTTPTPTTPPAKSTGHG